MTILTTFRNWLEGKSGDPATLLAEFRKYLEQQGADTEGVSNEELQQVLGEAQGGPAAATEAGQKSLDPQSMVDRLNRITGQQLYVVEDGFVGMKDSAGNVRVGNDPGLRMEDVDEYLGEKSGGSEDGRPFETKGWDESKHKRGQPKNSGQFGSGGGSGSKPVAESVAEKNERGGDGETPPVESAADKNARESAEPVKEGNLIVHDKQKVDDIVSDMFPDGGVKLSDLSGLFQSDKIGDMKVATDGEVLIFEKEGKLGDEVTSFSAYMQNNAKGEPILTINTLFKAAGVAKPFETIRGIADQVSQCQKLGIKEIHTCGQRKDDSDPPTIGYKVWPRFGYDGDIPPKSLRSLPENLAGAKKVSDLYATPEGKKWWEENGTSAYLKFDTTPGSYSMKTLERFTKRGKASAPPAEEQKQPQSRAERMLGKHTEGIRRLGNKALVAEFDEWLEGKSGSDDVLVAEFLRFKGLPSAFGSPAKGGAAKGDGGGHWVTIGAKDGHGGTPVFIKGGKIEKGAPSLAGKKIDSLEDNESSFSAAQVQGDKGTAERALDPQQAASPVEENTPPGLVDSSSAPANAPDNAGPDVPRALVPAAGEDITPAAEDEGVPRALTPEKPETPQQAAGAARKEMFAQWDAKAKEAGHDPKHLRQLAGHIKAHYNEKPKEVAQMLADARNRAGPEKAAVGLRHLSKKQRLANRGKESAYGSLNPRAAGMKNEGESLENVRGFDELAGTMAHDYPDLFGGGRTARGEEGETAEGDRKKDYVAQLKEYFANPPQSMTDEQALEEAFNDMEQYPVQQGDAAESESSGEEATFNPSEFDEPDAPAQGGKRGSALSESKTERLRGITGKSLEVAKWDILVQEHIVPLFGAERAAAISDQAMLEMFHGNGTMKDVAAAYKKALTDTESYTPETWQAMGRGYLDMSIKSMGPGAIAEGDSEEEIEKIQRQAYTITSPGKYMPCGETATKLPSGVYDVKMDMMGNAHYNKRDLESDQLIKLSGSVADEVLAEIADFWNKGAVFKKYGFLHRRGYLLHGTPGGGKSCLIYQIMDGIVKKDGVAFFCQNPYSFIPCMEQFREVEPKRKMVCVFEDIDTLIQHFGDDAMLQWLDGNHQVSRCINIATTNYPEKLDPRIVARPRRFDRILRIDAPDSQMRDAYFAKKVPDLTDAERFQWVDATDGLTFAALSEVVIAVMCLENDLLETVQRLKKMDSRDFMESDRAARGTNVERDR